MNNDAAERRQQIAMTSVSQIMLIIRTMYAAVKDCGEEWSLRGGTEDLKAAYRQCPLLSAHVQFAITMVWNPYSKTIDYHELYGQPFGAGHAVPNFYRLAAWAMAGIRRLLFVVGDHFFDDYFYIEPKNTAPSAAWALQRFMQIVGLKLDSEKSQLPRSVWHALGVVFDMRSMLSSRLLLVKAKETRVLNALVEMVSILQNNRLRPSHAAKVFGKLDFLNTTLFGRVGRTGLGPLKQRQHATEVNKNWQLNDMLRAALAWLIEILLLAPPREMRLDEAVEKTCLLYTDGSSDPSRTPKHVVGAVLFDPFAQEVRYTYTPVPEHVVNSWVPMKQQIHLTELFAGPLSLDTWQQRLQNRHVIHFVDNSAALAALVKGYSSKDDCIKLSSDYWLRAASGKVYIYVDRVESKSNISDEPSRLCFDKLMPELGAVYDPPVLNYLDSPAPLRDPTTWFGSSDRWRKIIADLHAGIFPTTPDPARSKGSGS